MNAAVITVANKQAKQLRSIQALRFLAASLVVYAHSVDSAQRLGATALSLAPGFLENFGAIGVDIFFVISGFIIAYTAFFRSNMTAREFIRHRIIRVVPFYYLLSVPWAVMRVHFAGFHFGTLIATALFWPAMPHGMAQPYLDAGWTLCFEMLFYVSIAFALLGRWAWLFPVIIFVANLAIRSLTSLAESSPGGSIIVFLGSPLILEFLAGVGIAYVWHRGLKKSVVVSALSISGVVVFVVYLLTYGYDDVSEQQFDAGISRVLLFGTPAALLITGALQLEPILAQLPLAALVFLGDASYSIYLVHPLVIFVAEKVLKHLHLSVNGDAWILISLVASISAGGVVHWGVEGPLLRLLRRYGAPKKQPEKTTGMRGGEFTHPPTREL